MFDSLEWWQALALAPAAVAALVACFVCVMSPSRGVKLIVLTLPIYYTSQALLNRFGQFFGNSQTIIFADILTVCTFAGILISRARLKAWSTPNWISWAFLLFLAVSVASLVNLEDVDRMRGLMALITYALLLIFVFVIETLVTDERMVTAVIRVWFYSYVVVLSAGVIGILTLYLGISNLTNFNLQQVRATFRFPNQLSLYLVVTSAILWPVASVRALGIRKRILIRASLPVMLAVLWYSGSRSGLAAFGAASAASLFFNRRGRQAFLAIGLASLCVLGLTMHSVGRTDTLSVASSRYGSLLSALGQDSDGTFFSFYGQTNAVAMKAVSQHPVLGGGIGGVLNGDITAGSRYEVHNTYLGIAGQTGVLGFGVAALIVTLAVMNSLKARRRARSPLVRAVAEGCIAALAGVSVHAFANYDWRIRHLWLLLALSSGLRIAADRTRWNAQRVPAPRPEALARAHALGIRAAGAVPRLRVP